MTELPPPLHVVTCAQLARERDWHRVTAMRWLKKLREKRGERFAWMQDGQWVTSREVLQHLAAEEQAKLITRLEPRIARVERELAEERLRNDALHTQIAELKRVRR